MADEPENATLQLLREIRATQGKHGDALARLERRFEDLYTMSTHTLGVAVSAHERWESEALLKLARGAESA